MGLNMYVCKYENNYRIDGLVKMKTKSKPPVKAGFRAAETQQISDQG